MTPKQVQRKKKAVAEFVANMDDKTRELAIKAGYLDSRFAKVAQCGNDRCRWDYGGTTHHCQLLKGHQGMHECECTHKQPWESFQKRKK